MVFFSDDHFLNTLIRSVRQAQGQSCHIRSCEQSVTGRRLNYRRALNIVQNEEYLNSVDKNIIRSGRVFFLVNLWLNWVKPMFVRYKRETLEKNFAGLANNDSSSQLVHSVVKRNSDYCFTQILSSTNYTSTNSTTCVPVASGALATGLLALLFVGAKLTSLFPRAPAVQPPVVQPQVLQLKNVLLKMCDCIFL